MKKTWTKPFLVAEEVSLNQQVAVGCTVKPGNGTAVEVTNVSCSSGDNGHNFNLSGETLYVFVDNIGACTTKWNNSAEMKAWAVQRFGGSANSWGSNQHGPVVNNSQVPFNS